ncbi:MAG: beta-lactamase family protein [Planctomycetaceae bacterium]|nr:beta-lactamase family protein [Planctomycetaceae bacterium]
MVDHAAEFDHSADALPTVRTLIARGIDQQLHYGMQVYVSREGEVVADFALGKNTSDAELTTDTLMLWLSSGKPITAAAVLQLCERGLLALDDRVTRFIPDFGVNGKHEVRLSHLLTHTAGLKPIVSGWPHKSWDQILQRIIQSTLQRDWQLGTQAAYDPARSWFVLGEVIHRVTGLSVDAYVRAEILEPLQMTDCWMAVPGQLFVAYGNRIGHMYGQKDGRLHPTGGHERAACLSAAPGSSMRGPANQLGRFYEMLLREGASTAGKAILSPRTVADMTRRQRQGIEDQTFRHVVDFGWGVIINSARYGDETVPYGFGRHATALTFGHGGAQSSIGFADPVHDLVVVMIANGCPGEELHNARFRALATAVYDDLEL